MTDTAKNHDTPVEAKVEAAPVSDDRRRLLRLGAYVPPAILGMAILGRATDASAGGHAYSYGHYKGHNIGSCMPSSCSPCIDSHEDDFHNSDPLHDGDVNNCKVEKAKKSYNDSLKR